MEYQIVVGLEVHVQLLTESKLFSGCVNRFNPDEPNTQTDPVILGLPGSLPVMNRQAFLLAVRTALALECEIARFTKWDRKQYFYPDSPRGYQISQYDLPFSQRGRLEIPASEEGDEKVLVRINRVHLEDDAGKNMHDESGRGGESMVDLNRAGTPLLEIVSEPDMKSAFQARKYLEELRLMLLYLGVSDCNMQEGSLRCDANVNLHVAQEDGSKIATPIVEIKNMNSFRNVEAAINYEAGRQFEQWKKTGQKMGDVSKQTWGWDANKQVTFPQRSKEEAADYRYFPDPDLVPVTVSDKLLKEVKAKIVELPAARRERFIMQYQLSKYDAGVIIDQGKMLADYFEAVAKQSGDGKQAANWMTQDVLREMKERGLAIAEFPLSSEILGTLIARVVGNKITIKSGREVFAALLEQAESRDVHPSDVDYLIQDRGLEVVSDEGAFGPVIAEVLAKNEKIVADVRGGKVQAIGPLIGQVAKQIKGADPKRIRELLLAAIGE